MLKQSPSRNQRSRGFKLKHVVQICVLLVICMWLLYRVKHFLDKDANKDGTKRTLEKVGNQVLKLGRKDLDPGREDTALKSNGHGEGGDDGEEDDEESRAEESEDEVRGIGDDDVDGRDQDRVEEEEFVDEEDKEREEGSDG